MSGRRGGGESARPTLQALRRELRAGLSPQQEARWLARLAGDPRRGARDLAGQLERRREARRREARRLSRLFALRRRLFARGVSLVAGVDEVGVGPLAGPLVAAAVVLPARVDLPGLDDSKRLSAGQRERLDRAIREQALSLCVVELSPAEVDRHNVFQASLLAMRRAVTGLEPAPEHVLVDARTLPGLTPPQTALVHGDARDGSIAAASIVAKVHRDARMGELDRRHPGYGFARHKGYPTSDHLAALTRLGPSVEHRRSFAPVAEQLGLG